LSVTNSRSAALAPYSVDRKLLTSLCYAGADPRIRYFVEKCTNAPQDNRVGLDVGCLLAVHAKDRRFGRIVAAGAERALSGLAAGQNAISQACGNDILEADAHGFEDHDIALAFAGPSLARDEVTQLDNAKPGAHVGSK